MSAAIDILKHEHDIILAALNLLDSLSQQMGAEQAVDARDVDDLLSVFREFADKCHHGKEEDLLFPALVKTGLAADSGPLAEMLREHVEGRRAMRAMEDAAQAPLEVAEFVSAAQDYSRLLRAHIEKENTILFPMANQVLSAAQLDALERGFGEFESKTMGPGRHDELHALIKRLQRRYLM